MILKVTTDKHCRIVLLQKRAVRIIAKVGYRESTAEMFKELKLLRVDQINELEISILMFKYNSGQAPYRLNQLFKPNHMVHSYETRNRNNCYFRDQKFGTALTVRQKILCKNGRLIPTAKRGKEIKQR